MNQDITRPMINACIRETRRHIKRLKMRKNRGLPNRLKILEELAEKEKQYLEELAEFDKLLAKGKTA